MRMVLGSSGSVQSWASSLSADSQSEEAAVDFMKSFVPLLFDAPHTIDQEQKANFGKMVLVRQLEKCIESAKRYEDLSIDGIWENMVCQSDQWEKIAAMRHGSIVLFVGSTFCGCSLRMPRGR